MAKNHKKLSTKKKKIDPTIPLAKFLEFDPLKPADVVEFHKHKLLYQLNEFMLKNDVSKVALAKLLGISRQAVTNKFLGEALTLDWIVRSFAVLGIGLEMKQSLHHSLAA